MITVYEYAKLTVQEKELTLRNEALFLDNYMDSENTVYVYFLNDFFVEVRMKGKIIIDNLPYKRGYKINKQNLNLYEKVSY